MSNELVTSGTQEVQISHQLPYDLRPSADWNLFFGNANDFEQQSANWRCMIRGCILSGVTASCQARFGCEICRLRVLTGVACCKDSRCPDLRNVAGGVGKGHGSHDSLENSLGGRKPD